jgi:hypothetical protein
LTKIWLVYLCTFWATLSQNHLVTLPRRWTKSYRPPLLFIGGLLLSAWTSVKSVRLIKKDHYWKKRKKKVFKKLFVSKERFLFKWTEARLRTSKLFNHFFVVSHDLSTSSNWRRGLPSINNLSVDCFLNLTGDCSCFSSEHITLFCSIQQWQFRWKKVFFFSLSGGSTGLPDFSRYNIPNRGENIPNGH